LCFTPYSSNFRLNQSQTALNFTIHSITHMNELIY